MTHTAQVLREVEDSKRSGESITTLRPINDSLICYVWEGQEMFRETTRGVIVITIHRMLAIYTADLKIDDQIALLQDRSGNYVFGETFKGKIIKASQRVGDHWAIVLEQIT